MSWQQTVMARLTQLTNLVNGINSNAKRTEDFAEQVNFDGSALVRVSLSGTSKKLALSKIVDAARDGMSGIRPWIAGTYSDYAAVSHNNVIYLLSNSVSLPFNSSDLAAEFAAGQWVLPFPMNGSIVDSPNTPVFDLGDITNYLDGHDLVWYINNSGDTYDLTAPGKTYFFRFVLNNIDYLCSYDSEAGGFVEYGVGSGNDMLPGYLHLFYNSSVGQVGIPQNLQQTLDQGRDYYFENGNVFGRWKIMHDSSGIGIYTDGLEIETRNGDNLRVESRQLGNGFSGNSVQDLSEETGQGTTVTVGAETVADDKSRFANVYSDEDGVPSTLQLLLEKPAGGTNGKIIFRSFDGNAFAATLDDIPTINDHFKGKFTSLSNLQSAIPSANDGDYAIVDSGSGNHATEYLWDAEDGWVVSSSVGPSTTDALTEGSTNLYFAPSRVRSTTLSGLSTATGGPIVSSDTTLAAFGKLQNQLTNILTKTLTGLNVSAGTISAVDTILDAMGKLQFQASANASAINFRSYSFSVYTKCIVRAIWGGVTLNTISGPAFAITGATVRNWSSASYFTKIERMGLVTAASAGSLAQARLTTSLFSRDQGFKYVIRFGKSENGNLSGVRAFIGLNTNSIYTNIEFDSLLDCIGIYQPSTSNNWWIVWNDSSGVASKYDLGTNFPANTIETDMYTAVFESVGSDVKVSVYRENTAYSYSTTLTTDIPASTTGLRMGQVISNNTQAAAVGFEFVVHDLTFFQ